MNDTATPMSGPAPGSNRSSIASLFTAFGLGAVVASLAWVNVIPDNSGGLDPDEFVMVDGLPGEAGDADPSTPGAQRRVVRSGGGGGTGESGDASSGANVSGGAAGGSAGGGSGPGGNGDSRGGGGGGGSGARAGISNSKITLGATYVAEGIACDFLCEVRDAMEAVRGRVNRKEGGVHGRQLDIKYKNDGWDSQLGKTFIENLVDENVFAFAVSPSSEGLNAASLGGVFRNNGVPVVGADGLNNTQFLDPWIWPVATATTTNVHIIMKWACDQGKRNPAIVFGNTYRFGVEGAYAFNQAYKRYKKCSGGENIPGYNTQNNCQKDSRYCGISSDASQYTSQTGVVEDACNSAPKCDFILLLLEPKTAQNWMLDFSNPVGSGGTGLAGAQPLFTTSFGDNCKAKCNGMTVWTGYNPPIGDFATKAEVAQYTQELTAQKGSADVFNQFSLGGYVGMELLVQALDKAGKDLTRAKLVATLNSMSLKTGLTAGGELRWTESERYANHSAHGYEMRWDSAAGRFGGFFRATGYIKDPWLGQDNQPPN